MKSCVHGTVGGFNDGVARGKPCATHTNRLIRLGASFRFYLGSATRLNSMLRRLRPAPTIYNLPGRRTCRFVLRARPRGHLFCSNIVK